MIGRAFRCNPIHEMGDAIPVTLQSLHHSISLQKEDFVNCMLCPSCDSIYLQVNKKFCELKGGNIGIVEKARETRFGMSPKYSRYIGIAS